MNTIYSIAERSSMEDEYGKAVILSRTREEH